MKINLHNQIAILAKSFTIIAAIMLAASTARAAVLVTYTSDSLGLTTAPSTDGYYYFDVTTSAGSNSGSDLSSLPSYISSVTPASEYTQGSYTSLTIGATTYQTGVSYTGYGSTDPIASFKLGSSVPSSFTLGVLVDNGTSSGYISPLEIADASGTVLASTATAGTSGNDFYFFTVTGAAANQTFTILGDSPGAPAFSPRLIGGLTFEVASVPEPSAYALTVCGLLLLAVMHRKHRLAS